MERKKSFINLIAALLLLLLVPASSYALTFTYGGNSVNFDGLDWSPGNALGVGAVPLSEYPDDPTSFDLLYQTSLGTFQNNGNPIGMNGLNTTFEITMVASATEIGSRSNTNTGQKADFSFDSSEDSLFQIWLDYGTGSNADPLTGLGYNDGVLLLEGTVVSSAGNFYVDLTTDPNESAVGPDDPFPNAHLDPVTGVWVNVLDGFGQDDLNGVETLFGTGGTYTTFNVDVTSINSTYILGTILEMDFDLFSDNKTPFKNTNPSAQVWDAILSTYVTPVYGDNGTGQKINGLEDLTGTLTSVDFHFEADGRSNLSAVIVPEPTTMLLFGFGLIGMAGLSRSRKNS